jgi:ABC-type bacteriocin/lantibiotic exporter with double-glycine peptidase domain
MPKRWYIAKAWFPFVPQAVGLLMVAFLIGGCSQPRESLAPHPVSTSIRIKGIPFFPQSSYHCGPASLAGILNYYGDDISPDDIADAIYRKKIRGTVSLDMALYPRERGFSSRWYTGSIDDIQRAVGKGTPLIVMVDRGLAWVSAHHFMVVTGYVPEGIVANTGKTQGKIIPWNRFVSHWHKTQNWTLLITPEQASGSVQRDD